MARFELVMPKLGESIIEATITKWLKGAGDSVEEDDPIVEIATDKVDSEIPSPVEGKITEILFQEGQTVAVGKTIAIIETEGADTGAATPEPQPESVEQPKEEADTEPPLSAADTENIESASDRFYSPLVKSIARKENITVGELDSIPGSGKDGRVTKQDILDYLKNRPAAGKSQAFAASTPPSKPAPVEPISVSAGTGDEIVEMDRMRKLIADHMVMSKQVSPHVTSFIEADVTNIVKWREKVKDAFLEREKQKLTFTPIFIEAAARVIREFPRINSSVDGTRIILRKNINIGMATALPNGNLIVPVIRNADQKNLLGITRDVNDLAKRARENKLLPDEIQGGTFTITNFGSFDSITGTPIINQPQVAILGIGAIRKKPVVIETPQGDMIGIRHMMVLSLAYDHRIVDGALGGMYLKRLRDVIESFDPNQSV
ncbi:MAG: 2-oxo acid dehydrogenase subunit E2 [Bacteroidetes bacterium]|nr:2-oxo acid dehydrogenase subunit E2 [Bacteroidota bacterium]